MYLYYNEFTFSCQVKKVLRRIPAKAALKPAAGAPLNDRKN
jgi:hypothetical protein